MRLIRCIPGPILLGTLVATLHACGDTGPAGPSRSPNLGGASSISDGANNGNEGFYFLPPMLADPGPFDAGFNGSQSPIVRICDPAGCAVSQLAEFTMNSGPGGETIDVVPAEEHYIVHWRTDQFGIEPGETWRINVYAFDEELGHVDVQLATNGSQARNITNGEMIGLADGRTLPIKFRIENGAAAESFPVTVADGGTIESADGDVSIDVPPGALTTDETITVEPIDATGGVQSAVEFGPEGLQFSEPVIVTLAFDAAALPPGTAVSDLALNTFEDGAWIVVPNSTVDPASGTVSAPVFHFSSYGVGAANRAVFCSGDNNANTFEAIEDALAAVVDGGTVAVCSGTHAVEGVAVSRPVTIESKGGATPVLTTNVQSHAFQLDGYATGAVIIDGLHFQMNTPNPGPDGQFTYAIRGVGTYAALTVRNATFTIGPAARGGISVIASTVGPTVTVENSTFTNGVFGIAAIDVPTLNITNSHFSGGTSRNLQYARSSGRAEGNTFGQCARTFCVSVRDPQSVVEIVNNTFAPQVLTGDVTPDPNVVIVVQLGATALLSGNDIQGCAYFSCVTVQSGGNATITGNTFAHVAGSPGFEFVSNIEVIGTSVTVDHNRHASCGESCYKLLDGATATVHHDSVNISQGHGGRSVVTSTFFQDNTATNALTFEDNVVIGTPPGDPFDASTWAAWNGLFLTHTGAVVNRNSFTNVYYGAVAAEASTLTGSDNVFDQIFVGVSVGAQGAATFTYNDFTNHHIELEDFSGAANLRCNWWGNAAGPQAVQPSIPATVYTPFATAPIAGTSHAGCVP